MLSLLAALLTLLQGVPECWCVVTFSARCDAPVMSGECAAFCFYGVVLQSFISRVEDLFRSRSFTAASSSVASSTDDNNSNSNTNKVCLFAVYFCTMLSSSSTSQQTAASTSRSQDAQVSTTNAGCNELLQGVLVFHYVTISRHLHSLPLTRSYHFSKIFDDVLPLFIWTAWSLVEEKTSKDSRSH